MCDCCGGRSAAGKVAGPPVTGFDRALCAPVPHWAELSPVPHVAVELGDSGCARPRCVSGLFRRDLHRSASGFSHRHPRHRGGDRRSHRRSPRHPVDQLRGTASAQPGPHRRRLVTGVVVAWLCAPERQEQLAAACQRTQRGRPSPSSPRFRPRWTATHPWHWSAGADRDSPICAAAAAAKPARTVAHSAG